MKKIIQIASIALVALSMLTSCAQESSTEPVVNNATQETQRYNGTRDNEWTVIQPTAVLKAIDMDDSGTNIWGLNPNGYVLKWNGNGWTQKSGKEKCISVSGDGTAVWGIADLYNQPEKWNGTNWTLYPNPTGATLISISVGNNNQVWAVTSTGKVVKWNGGSWDNYPGSLSQISVSPDGLNVYGIDKTTKYPVQFANGTWSVMNYGTVSELSYIDAGNGGLVWALNVNGYDLKLSPKGVWTYTGGQQKSVATTGNGSKVWGIQKTSGYPENYNFPFAQNSSN